MNYSTAILIINDNARAVKVTYESHESAPRTIFKTFDKSIKVDDYVVVPTDTRHQLTVCKVVEVDVDDWMGSLETFRWIVGRVNLEDVNMIKATEDRAIVEIKAAEKLKQRRELKASMEAALAENSDAIKLLQLSPLQTEDSKLLEEEK